MMISDAELTRALEDEWYGVRYSGEIPEVALCSALYYLAEDRNGPGLDLAPVHVEKLVEAAKLRYREIVLRDLNHENREKRIYRGIKRSIANWGRYKEFCNRRGVDSTSLKYEAAAALLIFLSEEIGDVERGLRAPAVNCSLEEVLDFASQLGIAASALPIGLITLFNR